MNTSDRNWPRRVARSPRVAMFLLSLCLCGTPVRATLLLSDVTGPAQLSFRHTDGARGAYHIAETVSAGLALFDYDLDGDIDLYFLNGAYRKDPPAGAAPPQNRLYRNDGGWRFTDVTDDSGTGDRGFGLGVAVADYDNDGDPDLYLNNFGPNVLLRNDGKGHFEDVTQIAGLADGDQMGAGVNFIDIEGDGDLDLYVSHYVKVVKETSKPVTRGGHPIYLGPAAELFARTRDTLYRNNGDGTFSDISEAAGLADLSGAGMGTICADFDRDGDSDIFVANDMSGNALLLNDGSGHFEEIGLLAGIGFDEHGEEQGSMGVEIGDYDNDGWPDLHLTTYEDQWPTLYRNRGDGSFEDVTAVAQAATGTYSKVTWGNGLVDLDNDGDLDLFMACGHLQPFVDAFGTGTRYLQTNCLFENTGEGRFKEVSGQAGDGLRVRLSSRGAGFDDLDNDGDIDVVILNSRAHVTLLRNDCPDPGHWVQVRLQGIQCNREGIGCQVTLVSGELSLLREVHSGRSYQSHYGTRLYFGLGARSHVDYIEVRWLGGKTERFEPIGLDRVNLLVQGRGGASR